MKRLIEDIRKWYKGIVAAIAYCFLMNLLIGQVCPMVFLTGFPCPGCGLTRAGIALLSLDFKEAFQLNCMIFPIAAFLLYFCICRYILQCKCRGCYVCIVLIIILLLVLYGYRMLTMFPDEFPMRYYRDNFLQFVC